MWMRLGKLYQISGFVLLVAMLFAGFSVCSYSPEDPAWNQYVSDGQRTRPQPGRRRGCGSRRHRVYRGLAARWGCCSGWGLGLVGH